MAQQRIHFIGGGQMAEAIIRALVGSGTVPAHLISAADVREERVRYLSETYRIQAAEEPKQALAEAELIVIAVRPQDDLAGVGGLIREFAGKDGVVVSIVAGVTIAKLESYVGSKRSVVRVIPNTLTDTGFGYSGVAFNEHAELAQVEAFLNGFGKVQVVDEAQLDVFTGYGVAGPNYVYYFIESLADAGVLAGLPREQAWRIALENVEGAVAMLRHTGLHPRQLLDINNSPGGVGIYALHELNRSDFAAGLQRSVLTAVRRTTELGKEVSQ